MCANIICKSFVRGSFTLEFFKFYKVFLFLMLFAAGVPAQGTGDSVFIINQTTTNNSAGVVADYLAGEIGEGLQSQYPCVDYSSPEDVKAVLDAAREKELLTGELDEEQLANLADAVGARYIVLVSVTVLPNGQTLVSAKLLDTKTTSTIANELETAANAEAAFDTAESVTKKLMQSFSNIFKRRCEQHWTGTITYTHQIQMSKTENYEGSSAGAHYAATVSQTNSEILNETANILLQPMALGFSGDSTKGRVTQNYSYHQERIRNENGTIPCREPGRNTFRKQVTGDETEIRDKKGSSTEIVSVEVSVRQDGKYQIKVYRIEHIKTKEKFERSGNIMACKPIPFSSISETDGLAGVGYIDLEGQVDPKNPDFLAGKIVEGDIETGQKTWTWNLRRVNPNKKK